MPQLHIIKDWDKNKEEINKKQKHILGEYREEFFALKSHMKKAELDAVHFTNLYVD